MLVFRLYWFQNSSVLSVGIGGDVDETDEFDDVDTEDDLDLKGVLDNLYLAVSAAGGYPEPGENDFVLFLFDFMSSGVT